MNTYVASNIPASQQKLAVGLSLCFALIIVTGIVLLIARSFEGSVFFQAALVAHRIAAWGIILGGAVFMILHARHIASLEGGVVYRRSKPSGIAIMVFLGIALATGLAWSRSEGDVSAMALAAHLVSALAVAITFGQHRVRASNQFGQ